MISALLTLRKQHVFAQVSIMKKNVITVMLLTLSLGASAQLSFPGSNWSTLTINPSPIRGTPEDNNILLQGNLEQGAIVARFGNDWRLNAYGAVAYSYDRNGLSYNNKVTPSIGVKIQKDFSGNTLLEAGIAVMHQNSYRGVTLGSTNGTGVVVYVQYWTGWNLKK